MYNVLSFQLWCSVLFVIYLQDRAFTDDKNSDEIMVIESMSTTDIINDIDNEHLKKYKDENNELNHLEADYFFTTMNNLQCQNCSSPNYCRFVDGDKVECVPDKYTDERCWKCNGYNEICSEDSYLVQFEYPLCCNSTALRCQCKPCQPIKCGSNQSLMVLSVGNKKPGSCCDTYKCIEGPDMCSYDKVIYKDGDVWHPDKCSICRCEKGLVYCSRKTCKPQMGCGYMYTPVDECCPVCGGCMSDSRLFMLNQSWFEADGCFKCNCHQGRAKCTAEYCLSPPCKNPKKIENVCCPVCEDAESTDMMITPATCSSVDYSTLLKCNLTCEFGLQKGPDGCLKCACAQLTCFNDCLYGHAFEEPDKRTCECRSAGCDRIKCDKMCVYGFQESDKCMICKCRSCQKLNCSKTCIYGSQVDGYGCPTCECIKANEIQRDQFPLKHCLHENEIVDHMEIFYDGCRQCICINGTTLCTLISCPSANICPTMTIRKGECCPSCTIDDHKSVPTKMPDILNNLCVGNLGQPLPDGESLIIDRCTTCKCFLGKAFCSVAHCEDTLSNCSLPSSSVSPFKIFGSCCPSCSQEILASSVQNISISTKQTCIDDKSMHYDGEMWLSNVCQSCICRNGTTYCYPHQCPLLSCSVAVLKKGTCCPFCLERALMTVCIFNENVYRNGESWNISDCSSCVCSKGQIVCTRTLCAPLRCNLPVMLPGHCCPICLDLVNLNVEHVDHSHLNKYDVKKYAYTNNMLYVSLLVAIILLVIILVILLIIIIWRANPFRFSRNYKNKSNAFSIGPFSKRNKLSNRKMKSFSRKNSSVASSLCASIQFDNSDNSAGNLLLSSNGAGTINRDRMRSCSKCSLSSSRMMENGGRLIKYEIIGGGVSKCGATVGISERGPSEYTVTTTTNPSVLMLSTQHSIYNDDAIISANPNRTVCQCSNLVIGHREQDSQNERLLNCGHPKNIANSNNLMWDTNPIDPYIIDDKIYNETNDKCDDKESTIYV